VTRGTVLATATGLGHRLRHYPPEICLSNSPSRCDPYFLTPFVGSLFEGFVAAEIAKAQVNAGRRREIYFFRDQQRLEVDFVVPRRGGGVRLIEVNASSTVMPGMAGPMQRLAAALRKRARARGTVDMVVVHRPTRAGTTSTALAPGVRALPWQRFVTDPLA